MHNLLLFPPGQSLLWSTTTGLYRKAITWAQRSACCRTSKWTSSLIWQEKNGCKTSMVMRTTMQTFPVHDKSQLPIQYRVLFRRSWISNERNDHLSNQHYNWGYNWCLLSPSTISGFLFYTCIPWTRTILLNPSAKFFSSADITKHKYQQHTENDFYSYQGCHGNERMHEGIYKRSKPHLVLLFMPHRAFP